MVTLYSLVLVAQIFSQPWIRSSHVMNLAIAPATLLMGAAFPIGMRLWAENGPDVVRRVGSFYSLNVCGSIAGSIAAGFVLLPRLGARTSLIVAASMYAGSSLWLLAHLRTPRMYRWLSGVVIVSVVAWGAVKLPDPFAVALSKHPQPVFWREEGLQTTVSVHAQAGGGLAMFLDGLHQANDSASMLRLHREIGLLPLALHPDPKRVLVIGLGGGATAGAASRHVGVSLDVVELSPEVVRAASTWFSRVNHEVVRAPNVTLRVDDGRNFLLLNRGRRYDAVTADIIQPNHAGAGNVYSAEYFRLARAALNEGGVMLQWVGHRETTPYKLIMRTFLSVFPDATLWASGTLMVGALEPLKISRPAFEKKLGDEATRAALHEIGLDSFDALLGQYTAGPDEMRAIVGDGPILTDDRPLIEYSNTMPRGDPPIDLGGVKGDVEQILADNP
jgi:spermidine synthase